MCCGLKTVHAQFALEFMITAAMTVCLVHTHQTHIFMHSFVVKVFTASSWVGSAASGFSLLCYEGGSTTCASSWGLAFHYFVNAKALLLCHKGVLLLCSNGCPCVCLAMRGCRYFRQGVPLFLMGVAQHILGHVGFPLLCHVGFPLLSHGRVPQDVLCHWGFHCFVRQGLYCVVVKVPLLCGEGILLWGTSSREFPCLAAG